MNDGLFLRFLLQSPLQSWISEYVSIIDSEGLGGWLLKLGTLEIVMFTCSKLLFTIEV